MSAPMRLSERTRCRSPQRVLSALLFGAALLTGGAIAAVGGEHPRAEAASVTRFDGAAGIALDNIGFGPRRLCMPIGVALESGDFFYGLERLRGPHELEFHYRKGTTVVSEFPEFLIVEVRAVPSNCELGELGVGLHSALVWDERFMRSWRFRLTWVNGAQERPVDVISTEAWKPLRMMAGPPHWNYCLLVRSKSIPITADLKLEVLSPEGQRLARLIGGMDRAVPTYGLFDQVTDMEPRPYPH